MLGFNADVCTAGDIELWTNPNYWVMAMIDDASSEVVGFCDLLEHQFEWGRCLILLGINPNPSFVATVDGGRLAIRIVEMIRDRAMAGDYYGLLIPADPCIHSNRGEIQAAIREAGFPTRTIAEVIWNRIPGPMPFKRVFVVWERRPL